VDLQDPWGHVALRSFGRKGRPRGGKIETLINEAPAVSPILAEQLMRAAYLDDFRIRPADAVPHPLDVVRKYDKEDVVEGGPVRSLMRKYSRYEIKEQYGLSWTEFKNLPFDESAFMIEQCEALALRKIDTHGKQYRDIERDLRSMKS
jgi:hypothetical protein